MVFNLGGFLWSYYGMVYALGALLFVLLPWPKIAHEPWLLRLVVSLYVTIGAIVGGRLGYVIVYDPIYYLNHVETIVQLNLGGMSYIGGIVGFALSLALLCRYLPGNSYYERFFTYSQRAVLCALVVVPLGRIGNFFNGELYGTITDVPWAVIFSRSGDLMPRHPVQIYEALALGPVLALLLYLWARLKLGSLVLGYLLGYSVLRFLCEIVREPDIQLGYIWGPLTMGQIQCLILFICVLIAHKWFHF